MTTRRRELGQAGETAAEQYLRQQGFSILARNQRLGRLGELDLICREGACLVFVEVKSKVLGEVLGGFENITLAKQRKLAALASAYMQLTGQSSAARFDAVEVEFPQAGQQGPPRIRHIRDAFRTT